MQDNNIISLGINIFWICPCLVSSEARDLVCTLEVENPSQPPACRSGKDLCCVLYPLVSYKPFQKLNIKPSFGDFFPTHRKQFYNLIAVLDRNFLLIFTLHLLTDGLYPFLVQPALKYWTRVPASRSPLGQWNQSAGFVFRALLSFGCPSLPLVSLPYSICWGHDKSMVCRWWFQRPSCYSVLCRDKRCEWVV